MIIIKSGEKQIYNPKNPNLEIINPKLILEDNAAGQLSFKIYEKNNRNYAEIKKLFPVVSVLRDGKTIFKGRVISDKKDFYNGKTVEVEGKLAFLNDSMQEPFEFSGAPAELFKMIIENHNSQVLEWQKFKVGKVTVADNNDYIVRSSEYMMNTWEALKDKCFKSSMGGHIQIRYEEDGDYIDWLADYEKISSQSIAFARNMIDISVEVNALDTYTAIRPIGAEVDGKKIDISSVNYGKKYIVNEEMAEKYGIIYAPESESTWNDVTLPENLLKKAKEKLFGTFVKLNETYEINAVDLNLTDASIEALNICEYVNVKSTPHGISGNYLLNKAELFLAEPQESRFYLGATKKVLSDNMGSATPAQVVIPKNVSEFENDSNYTNAEEVVQIVSEVIGNIPGGLDGASAYEIALKNGYEGTEEEWLASLKGTDGKDGADGKDGTNGKDGIDGLNGTDGKDGKSAYEIAQANGFEGTEEEWLESLKCVDDDITDRIVNVENELSEIPYNYASKEELETQRKIVGGSVSMGLTNVEYTTQTVSGDEFMPLYELNRYGNLVNALKDLSSKIANMFSSLNNYFASKNGSNATGTWGIDISGNAASATKATQDGSGNIIVDTYASKNELKTKADQNPYCMTSSTAGYASSGYVAFARLQVKSGWQNSPIEFEIICRGRHRPCRISIQFESSSATDPSVVALSYAGGDYGVFAHKIATSTWELYYTKSEPYDMLTVTRISKVDGSGVEITHPGSYLSTKPTKTIVNASLGWNVAYATKATQDESGNVIADTYVKKEDLSEVKSTTINVSDTISGATGSFTAYKYGKVCTLTWTNINNINYPSWSSGYTLAVLPEGFRPIKEVTKDPLCGGAYAPIDGKLAIYPGGGIAPLSPKNITDITNGTITYITN